MIHAPVYLVDTAITAPERWPAMIALIHNKIVPAMTDVGAELVSCLATSPDIDEAITFQTTWRIRDHAEWNRMRRDLFLDTRFNAIWAEAAMLRSGGSRRFFYPVPEPE